MKGYTVRELINEGREALEKAGVGSPAFDARLLCSFVLGYPLSELPLHYGDPVEEAFQKAHSDEIKGVAWKGAGEVGDKDEGTQAGTAGGGSVSKIYSELIERRASGEPLQYITGEQEFMGLSFKADERALIPRLDTEILAENALKELREMQSKMRIGDGPLGANPERQMRIGDVPSGANSSAPDPDRERETGMRTGDGPLGPVEVLDLCCGTGVLGLSIAKLAKDVKVTLLDISEDALSLARENADRLGLTGEDADHPSLNEEDGSRLELAGEVEFVQSDMFAEVSGRRFDMIVSNPPYIPTDVISELSEDVRDHEPLIALDGGTDGLDHYRSIAEGAYQHLRPWGSVLLEIGQDQAEDVSALLKHEGFGDIEVIKDLAGLDRVVKAKVAGQEG